MNHRFRLLALAVLGLGAAVSLRAAGDDAATLPAPPATPPAAPAEKTPILADLEQLVGNITAKLKATDGVLPPAELAADMAQFEAIIAKHPEAAADEKAGVLWTKALLYLQVFDDFEQGEAIVRRFKAEYPTTEFATKSDEILAQISQERVLSSLRKAVAARDFDGAVAIVNRVKTEQPTSELAKKSDELLAAIERQRKADTASSALVVGAAFPGLEGKAIDGTAVSTAALKGKVVLVDFWATWCPPCREELPNVLAAYEKFHAKGFAVVAVSLDRDEAELKKFVEEKKMPWPQIYEGANALAEKFGVESIPTTYLVDAEGKIVATDLRGDALEKLLEKLLGGK